MPMAAVIQIDAAVVSPVTRWGPRLTKIVPAPRKLIPVPMASRMRSGSVRIASPWPANRLMTYSPSATNSAAPMAASMCVRSPADLPLRSRSQPMAPPSARAMTMSSSTAKSGCIKAHGRRFVNHAVTYDRDSRHRADRRGRRFHLTSTVDEAPETRLGVTWDEPPGTGRP